MMIRFLFIFLLFKGGVVSATLHGDIVRHPKESGSKRSAAAELIIENFVQLDHGLNETWMANDPQTPDGDEHSTIETTSIFADLLLPSGSTKSQVTLERDKGGTMKKVVPGEDTKGKLQRLKGTKQDKPKKVKGEKTKDKKEGVQTTAKAPSVLPSPSLGLPSSTPSQIPSSLPGENKEADDMHSSLQTISSVARSIPAFELGYTTSRLDNPGIKEYDELVEVTRVYINESLSDVFGSDIVGYDGSAVDSYRVQGEHSVEYHIRSTWTGEESQVLPTSDLGIIVTNLFKDSTLQSYLERLRTKLPSSNVFSSTTAVTLEQTGAETGSNKDSSASTEDGSPGSDPDDKSGALIGISIAAGGILACLVILAIYCRRRGQVGDIGNDAMKPDTAEVSTLDTNPMMLSEVSFRVQRNSAKDDLATEPFDQQSTFERDGNFSEISLNEI